MDKNSPAQKTCRGRSTVLSGDAAAAKFVEKFRVLGSIPGHDSFTHTIHERGRTPTTQYQPPIIGAGARLQGRMAAFSLHVCFLGNGNGWLAPWGFRVPRSGGHPRLYPRGPRTEAAEEREADQQFIARLWRSGAGSGLLQCARVIRGIKWKKPLGAGSHRLEIPCGGGGWPEFLTQRRPILPPSRALRRDPCEGRGTGASGRRWGPPVIGARERATGWAGRRGGEDGPSKRDLSPDTGIPFPFYFSFYFPFSFLLDF
jgi:hypothetical protein